MARKRPKKRTWRKQDSILERDERYSVFKSGGYWVLQDTMPEEEGYVFERNGNKLYAAKIIAVCKSLEDLEVFEEFVRVHNEAEEQKKKGRNQ